jgi:transposase
MEPQLADISKNIDVCQTDHLPVIAAFCRELSIDKIVNRLVPSEMNLDPGTAVIGMILDTLSGRSPLYQLQDFFELQDTELLFGEPIPFTAFNDDAVGRVLDRLHDAGTMKIFTEISLTACQRFDLATDRGHFDTTSVNVWGDYKDSQAGGDAPHITYGHSKDKRPDLKQFMISLLCVEGNIPLAGKLHDGNAADTKLNNEELERLSSLIKATDHERKDFLYIADCKLVTEANLELMGDDPFITRLPASYNAHAEAIDAALKADKWETIGILNQTATSGNRPAADYKVNEQTIELNGKKYRAIVVHSSSHAKQRTERIERDIRAAEAKVIAACKQGHKQIYKCQGDAKESLKKLRKAFQGKLREVTGEIEEIKVYGPGRAPAEGPKKVKSISYRLKLQYHQNTQRISKSKERAGCFVLLTNTTNDPESKEKRYSAKDCLTNDKGQYGVERNFSFLKEPLIVNDIFLKKPERINALGMVMILSLLVWSLMERTMRKTQAEKDLKLKDLDRKPTKRPTSFIMIHKFRGILVMRRGRERCLASPLSYEQGQYLIALGLKGTIFTSKPNPPNKNTS